VRALQILKTSAGLYILMHILILLLVPAGWRGALYTISGSALGVMFFAAMFQLVPGGFGFGFLETLRRRITAGLFILIGVAAAAGFGLKSIAELFK